MPSPTILRYDWDLPLWRLGCGPMQCTQDMAAVERNGAFVELLEHFPHLLQGTVSFELERHLAILDFLHLVTELIPAGIT